MKRKASRELRLRETREAAKAKSDAGLVQFGRNTEAERGWRRQMGSIPADTRSLTGMLCGDPIPGDPRCPWRPRVGSVAR